jgi:hypothetical protein
MKWVTDSDIRPVESLWFVAYVNGKRTILKFNAPNQFWVDFTGKTYSPDLIDKWLDDGVLNNS